MFTIPRFALRNVVYVEDYLGATGDGRAKYGSPRKVRCKWRGNFGVSSANKKRVSYGSAWMVVQNRKRNSSATVSIPTGKKVNPADSQRVPERFTRRPGTDLDDPVVRYANEEVQVQRGDYIPLESRVTTVRGQQFRVTRIEELENAGWVAPTYLMVHLKDWGDQ